MSEAGLHPRRGPGILEVGAPPRDTLAWELRADEVTPGWAAAYPVVMDEEEA